MGIRLKLFLVFFICGIVPMLFFTVLNYFNGVRAVEEQLGREVESDARASVRSIENALNDREAGLMMLARAGALRDYVMAGAGVRPLSARTRAAQPAAAPSPSPAPSAAAPDGSSAIPAGVRAEVEAFLLGGPKDFASVACLNAEAQPLFRAEPGQGETTGAALIRYQTADFLPSSIAPDERVWAAADYTPLRSTVLQESFGPTIRYTLPIFAAEAGPRAPRGALVVDLKLNALCQRALGTFADGQTVSRLLLVLDRQGQVVYHTNAALFYQPVKAAMPPSFGSVADSMQSGESGQKFFETPEGNRWLASYRPIKSLGISLGVAVNDTNALKELRRTGQLNIILSALAGLLTAALLTLVARRMERSIERVTAGAVAIAGGQLDQRIEVRSSDETRLLAESFNQMTDRLREQIARESETRQFESFMRLAAMLTHDLKNAITALSLVVSNMEQQFDREEFRAEAMESLKESTDKLRSLVSKLSGPVESLSGEYQRPRSLDLVPHIRRVLAAVAPPARQLHQINIHLPDQLIAIVDGERIERVFENLILNALEAMGTKSGTLTVEAGSAGDDKIFFSVSDTGPGISEEFQRTRLFRAFSTTKRKGVGLGLYTCREVVTAHGGNIEVKSEEGAGATFRVVLPSGRFTESA